MGRGQGSARPDRGHGSRDPLLGDILSGRCFDLFHQFTGRCLVQPAVDFHFVAPETESAANEHLVPVFQHVLKGPGIAAPPGGNVGDLEWFAQQLFAETRHEGLEHGGFDQSGAEGIGYGHVTCANRLEEACGPAVALLVQFEGVTGIAVGASENHVHREQPTQGLEHHAALADGQVPGQNQRVPQVASEVAVFKITGATWARAPAARFAVCRDGSAPGQPGSHATR